MIDNYATFIHSFIYRLQKEGWLPWSSNCLSLPPVFCICITSHFYPPQNVIHLYQSRSTLSSLSICITLFLLFTKQGLASYFIPLLTYLRLYIPSVEHRPQTSCFHTALSCALLPTSDQFHPCCVISFSTSLRHVFLGLPTLRWPRGLHLRACFAMQSSDFLNVCPIQFHLFLLIIHSTDSVFALLHKSSFCTFSHHRIFKILRSPLFMNTWTLLCSALVYFHVSDPYNRTDKIFDLKILNFVLRL